MNSHSHGLSHMNYHYHSHSTDHSSSPPSLFVQAPSHAHTMNSSFTALAVPSTCFLAATVEENGAGFTGVSEISPVRYTVKKIYIYIFTEIYCVILQGLTV